MQDHPGVRVLPPKVLLVIIVSSAVVSLIAPVRIFRKSWARLVGIPIIAAGVGILGSAFRLMQKSGTNIDPGLPVVRLVQDGPFRFTRNPLYLGLTLSYMGLGFLANSLWFVPFAAAFILILQTQVIRYEEAYLEGKFGEDYRRYKNQVRRWI